MEISLENLYVEKVGVKGLKGTFHKDIVVLNQFCAEVILVTKCHLTYTQNHSLEIDMKEISNKFHREE